MKNKVKKELDGATRASVKKEMAKPRMAKSAREAEANLMPKQNCVSLGVHPKDLGTLREQNLSERP
jgi:hypothetical protein